MPQTTTNDGRRGDSEKSEGDDYETSRKSDPPTDYSADEHSEPADPRRVNHATRRGTRIAPKDIKTDRLPTPLVECGCGTCIFGDPLDGASFGDDIDRASLYPMRRCDTPQPMTVARARKVYLHYQGAAYCDPNRSSLYARDLGKYGAIMEADRRCHDEYDGLTTAMLTRRLSPIEDGQWLTPWTLDQRLNDAPLRKSVTNALRYQLDGFDWEYIAVTAATDSAATPHEHIYCWIDDPDNEVTVGHLKSALEKHLDKCEGAYESDHEYRADGTAGAITVSHDPPLVDKAPDSFGAIREYRSKHADISEDSPLPANTAGAQYAASQLSHLVLADIYDGTRDVSDVRIEGAAVAWATPSDWFRASREVPAAGGGGR